jgi:hypothetical protein
MCFGGSRLSHATVDGASFTESWLEAVEAA